MSSFAKKIAAIQKSLDALKMELNKPKKISDCESKDQLKLFTTKELTAWLKKNKVDFKKTKEKYKNDFINIIWNELESESESESETDSSDSESEDD